jgi:hypothetical protein
MAGARGPVPKRSTERRRRNKDSEVEVVKIEAPAAGEASDAGEAHVVAPPADAGLHPIAHDWYESLKTSGQAKFFEPSDWQYARYIANVMSRNLKQRAKFSAVLFASVTSAMNDLLTTEASRRRVRLEIERAGGPEQPAGVTAIADYRKRLGAGGGK